MEKLETKHLIVTWANQLLGPLVSRLLALMGFHTAPGHDVIPEFMVMILVIVAGYTALGLLLKSRLSVENPGKLQIVLEDAVSALAGMLDEWIGPGGRRFLPLIGGLGAFILAGNYMGLVPGFGSPTSNINVTVACAITTWLYYQGHGIRAQGVVGYIKHFGGPAGSPLWIVPIMFPIEIISHLSRVMSLSLRLFGNIFGEELVIMILAFLSPWWFPFFPVPIMVLGLITGGLQAFIFVLLSIIYLQGAVSHDDHGHDQDEDSLQHETHPAAMAA